MAEIYEIKKQAPMPVAAGFEVNPQSFDEAVKWCSYISHSAVVPKAFQTPEGSKIDKGPSIYAAILKGRELGLKPMQALNSINVIEGRVSLSTDAKKAVCMGHGKISQHYTDNGNPTWTVKVERPNCATVEMSFSASDAAQAGLMQIKTVNGQRVWCGVKGAWVGYWKRMLLKRAMSWALDEAFPDILSGVATTEDLTDVQMGVQTEATQSAAATGNDPIPPKTVIEGSAEVQEDAPVEVSLNAEDRLLHKLGDK